MKINPIYFIGAGALLLILMSNKSAAAPATSILDLSSFDDQYGAENVQDLQNLLNELATRGLTTLQIQMMIAQALQETGLFTDEPNFNAVEVKNNYSGISNADGSITSFNSISDFVDDWIQILSKNNDPLAASNITDFNTRLKANGYYTDSAVTYGNNLNYYFNLLSQA